MASPRHPPRPRWFFATLPALLPAVSKRLLSAVPVVIVALLLTFVLGRLLPGDPAAALVSGLAATPQGLQNMRHSLGLDDSIVVQLGHYFVHLLHGDWGRSFVTGEPVFSALRLRLPASLELTGCSILISVLIAVPLGIGAAYYPGRWADRLCTLISAVGSSLPGFFIGLLLIYIFYVRLGWAPEPTDRLSPFLDPPPMHTGFLLIDAALAGDASAWWDAARRLCLPATTMAIFGVAPLARLTRTAARDALQGDAVRTARTLALRRQTILLHYVLLPAAPAMLTAFGMISAYMLGASVAVEKIFAWPGIASYALDALAAADYAPLQGFILCVASLFVLLNVVIDLLLALIDPRARGLQ